MKLFTLTIIALININLIYSEENTEPKDRNISAYLESPFFQKSLPFPSLGASIDYFLAPWYESGLKINTQAPLVVAIGLTGYPYTQTNVNIIQFEQSNRFWLGNFIYLGINPGYRAHIGFFAVKNPYEKTEENLGISQTYVRQSAYLKPYLGLPGPKTTSALSSKKKRIFFELGFLIDLYSHYRYNSLILNEDYESDPDTIAFSEKKLKEYKDWVKENSWIYDIYISARIPF